MVPEKGAYLAFSGSTVSTSMWWWSTSGRGSSPRRVAKRLAWRSPIRSTWAGMPFFSRMPARNSAPARSLPSGWLVSIWMYCWSSLTSSTFSQSFLVQSLNPRSSKWRIASRVAATRTTEPP